MDETTISAETLKLAAEHYPKLSELISGVTAKAVTFTDVLKVAGTEGVEAVKKIIQQSQELFSSFLNATGAASALHEGMVDFGGVIKQAFDNTTITTAAGGMLDYVGLIDKSITGMGDLGDKGYEAGFRISTAFKSMEPILKQVLGTGAMNLTSAMVEGASRVTGLEQSLINMSIAQGNANKYFEDASNKLVGVNDAYKNFVTMSVEAARETHQTVGSVMELNKALAPIPGSLDNGQRTVMVSQLASAAGRDQLGVAKQLVEMYTKLGASETEAYTALAYMQDQGGESKLRMESFNDTVMTIAGSFKMLGDNTIATTNFVKSFDKAFADSKISPEALKEVITSIGEGVQRMDVAKKAFVSGATGGPGGLAGAVQMDYAIQTGHADEVIKKTMLAMQNQFGGQVVTLKDAAENTSLAGEFYKQIQYLTQVAGIAKDDDQAKRILEAMKSGVMDNFKPGAGADEKDNALERQLGRGASRQEESNTTLMRVHQTMEETRLITDEFYKTTFKATDATIGKIAETLGVKSELTGNEQGSIHTGMSGTIGNENYIKKDWDDGSDNKTFNRMKIALGPLIGAGFELPEKMAPPKATTKKEMHTFTPDMAKYKEIPTRPIVNPPGTESGIDKIQGQTPKLGTPVLPTVNLQNSNSLRDQISAIDLKPQKVDVTVDVKMTGDDLLKYIRAEVTNGVNNNNKGRTAAILNSRGQ